MSDITLLLKHSTAGLDVRNILHVVDLMDRIRQMEMDKIFLRRKIS